MAGVLPDVVVLVRVLSRCRSRSLWAVRLQRAVGVCVCCVLFVVRQELLVVVLVLCICRKLARSCVYACHGARCAARFGMRHLGMLGQARDGARGVQAGHVRLQSRAQRASPSTTVRHGAQQNAFSPCPMTLPCISCIWQLIVLPSWRCGHRQREDATTVCTVQLRDAAERGAAGLDTGQRPPSRALTQARRRGAARRR